MAKPNLYAVSDGLTEIRRFLGDFEQTGVQLSGNAVSMLREQLKQLTMTVRRMEHEVSRHRWNELARGEREQRAKEAAAVEAELSRPGSNLALFPVIPRPFSDGQPRRPGGAA